MSNCSRVPKPKCQVAQNFNALYLQCDSVYYVPVAVKTQIDCKYLSKYTDVHEVSCTDVCLATKKELQVTRMRLNEASEKLMEKNRQYQKLQVKFS